MLRAVSIFVKDRVVHSSAGLQDFDSALLDNTKSISMSPTDKSRYVSTSFPPTLKKHKIRAVLFPLHQYLSSSLGAHLIARRFLQFSKFHVVMHVLPVPVQVLSWYEDLWSPEVQGWLSGVNFCPTWWHLQHPLDPTEWRVAGKSTGQDASYRHSSE